MTNIEIIIMLLLAFMGVPDFCNKIRRPALAYSIFVLIGIGIGPILDPEIISMLRQAGKIGFLLLLFEVGLEIDMPSFKEFVGPLGRAIFWSLAQYPFVFLLGYYIKMTEIQIFFSAAALAGCSVGMSFPAWKNLPLTSAETKNLLLHVMVSLEIISIISLAVGVTSFEKEVNWWIFVRFYSIALMILILAVYSAKLVSICQWIIEKTTHWRIHWLVLLVLAICAIGQRLGLDAPKTAFVLGLCMSCAKHKGVNLEDYIAPISQRFLIPIFFVALGLNVEWRMIAGLPALYAIGSAGLLVGVREIMHRRLFGWGNAGPVFLLFSPNLTLVALATSILLDHGGDPSGAAWLLMTGLFLTMPSIFLLAVQANADTNSK
jgi:Kef-type K+ transport system membrane component KefB